MRISRFNKRTDDVRCKGNKVILTLAEAARRFQETGEFSLSESEGISQYDGDTSDIDISSVTTHYDKVSTALRGLDLMNIPTVDKGDPGISQIDPSIKDKVD